MLLGSGEELVQVIPCPELATALREFPDGSGIAEAFMRGNRSVDKAIEVRANLVGTTLVDGVTARALLERCFACGCIGAGKQDCDGSGRDFRCCVSRSRFFGHDGEALLLRRFRMENPFRSDGHRHQDEDGAEKGTHAHVGIRVHLQSSPCSRPMRNRTILKSRGTYVFCITLATRLWSRNWDYLTLLCGDLKGLWA